MSMLCTSGWKVKMSILYTSGQKVKNVNWLYTQVVYTSG